MLDNKAAKPMTMSQKILARHAGLPQVEAGELIQCKVDMALGNDVTTPPAIKEFRRLGTTKVFDQKKIAIVPDHFTPNKDIATATQVKMIREFVREFGIVNFFEVGEMGVEHALLPEKGLVKPGDLVIGADSHTCTYGALGAFSTGIGSTDLAAAWATGIAWFKVPEAIKVILKGKLNPHVRGKDVMLHLIGIIGVDGALYQSIEFFGEGLDCLTLEDRLSMANMAIEAGGKNAIFPAGAEACAYAKERAGSCGIVEVADPDAVYVREIVIDLADVPLTVAFPHLPENTHDIEDAFAQKISIDQVVIGSCTNGRIEDMRVAAELLKGHKIHPRVRAIIIPATQEVWLKCVNEGLMNIFVEAGAAVSTPTCGPCLGGHMGILAEGERAVATTNRNFVGRMGHPKSEVYLASPAVAAASAISGIICGPQHLQK